LALGARAGQSRALGGGPHRNTGKAMLALFTDFGLEGPYTGQVKAVLHARAPGVPVIDLCADAPMFDPMLSAYLLAAYGPTLPTGTVGP